MEPSCFLLVCNRTRLLPQVSVEALFAVAKQEMLPLAIEGLTELHGHERDEDIDAVVEDAPADVSQNICSESFASHVLVIDYQIDRRDEEVEAKKNSMKQDCLLLLKD